MCVVKSRRITRYSCCVVAAWIEIVMGEVQAQVIVGNRLNVLNDGLNKAKMCDSVKVVVEGECFL